MIDLHLANNVSVKKKLLRRRRFCCIISVQYRRVSDPKADLTPSWVVTLIVFFAVFNPMLHFWDRDSGVYLWWLSFVIAAMFGVGIGVSGIVGICAVFMSWTLTAETRTAVSVSSHNADDILDIVMSKIEREAIVCVNSSSINIILKFTFDGSQIYWWES